MRSFVYSLLSLWLLVAVARGEEEQQQGYNGYDGANDAAAEQEEEEDTYYNTFSVCSDSSIVVGDISLVCDSPGAYYYGSNKYRNSATCQAGDKAKLVITLEIIEALESSAYINLLVKGYGTIESEQIYAGDELCSVSGLSSNYGEACPSQGYYTIERAFYWGEESESYENSSFEPMVIIGLASSADRNNYDLGGANTNLCSGDTFMNWTTGVGKSAANTLRTFFSTFGILVTAVIALFFVGWYITRQANRKPKEVIVDDDVDENDYHKIAMVGNNRNLVDF